jgi:rod shape-determining protein MreC
MRDYLDDRPIKLRRERTNAPASARPFLLALALCALAFGLIWLDRSGIATPARGFMQEVLSPVTLFLNGVRDSVAGFIALPVGNADLETRVRQLEQENSQLRAELIRIEQERVENQQLRTQLALSERYPWQLMGAEVAVRSPDAGRRVVTITRGTNDNVAVGMAVIAQTGDGPAGLVGIVEAVGPRTADVLLITDFGSQVSARVINEGMARLGLVQGQWQRGSRLRLEQVERDTVLRVGAPVVTAGLTQMLDLPLALTYVPADIPIGSIETVMTEGQGQVAELRPYVDPDQVRYVWVILSRDD